MNVISREQLQRSHKKDVLLDVRLNEDYNEAHLLGAVNNCVFEVTFLEQMAEYSKDTSIVVYGYNQDSYESRTAYAKLLRAGYTHVFDYRDGIQDWENAGQPVEMGPPVNRESGLPDGECELDFNASSLEWLGRNLLNKHHGLLKISRGVIEFQDGMPVSGEFTFNMKGMTCTDLAGSNLHDVLIAHLQSDDFFDVERFPEAVFDMGKAQRMPGSTPGAVNMNLVGDLTIKDITRPLSIPAVAGMTPEGQFALQASFSIDRTLWDVIYGSGQFFHRLAGHLVNDLIDIQIRLLTAKD